MLVVSSIAIGNALNAACRYQLEVLDIKGIGACTNNCAVSIYVYM